MGAGLLLWSLFLFLSLTSYHQADPSLNRAAGNVAGNIGGYIGAVVADIMLQSLGLASILALLVPLAWGVQMLRGAKIAFVQIRLSLLLITVALVACLLTKIDAPAWWPMNSGLGGSIGGNLHDMLYRPLKSSLFTSMLALFTLTATTLTFGINWEDWKELSKIVKHSFLVVSGVIISFIQRKRADYAEKYTPNEDEEIQETVETPAEPEHRHALSEWLMSWIGKRHADENSSENELSTVGRVPRVSKKSTEKPASKPRHREVIQASLDLSQNGEYELPPIKLLSPPPKGKKTTLSETALTQNAKMLKNVLQDFGVNGEIMDICPGPVVTLYELEPAAGTKSSRVIGLADDIARSMSAISTRIAVVPGRNVIGIEMPNTYRETVYFREMLESSEFASSEAKLPMALGKNIGGEPIIVDLARMPHLLVAGTTGSGKSVAINTMIMSLLYRLTPDECKFIMIDPKMLELSVYDGIPHLLSPVVTEPSKAVVALKWTVKEMENRYRLMNNHAVRNIDGYNKKLREARAQGVQLMRKVQTGFNPDTGEPIIEEQPLDMNELPFIVVVVDEMADLMIVAGKEIEGSIQRLAQMARAAGIHIIMATQRPSVDVITGVIKANFPTRISFQVTSRIDSRTILGEQGAEQLLGQGDMLYMAGGGRITRVHGPFVSDKEVEEVVAHLKLQGSPSYIEDVTRDESEDLGGGDAGETDEMYDMAVAIVARDRKASTSYIQRCLKIGYNKAAGIIEQMERNGVVSPANHVGKREVLVPEE
jgi:S-DNA-T family DNA segregation ATPase FtsK/SpoIIIE